MIRRRLTALLAIFMATGCGARSAEKPELMLMTGLPIVWGEGEIGDTLSGAREPAGAYRWLIDRYNVTLLDILGPRTLSAPTLLLAQPRALGPAELVALDKWVRVGGRVLVLADPKLDWASAHAVGDPLAPPRMTLLDPLLSHWGLRLDLREGGRETAGRFVRERGRCAVSADGLVARCGLGEGRAVIVADADFLHDSEGKAGVESLGKWIDELAGAAEQLGTKQD